MLLLLLLNLLAPQGSELSYNRSAPILGWFAGPYENVQSPYLTHLCQPRYFPGCSGHWQTSDRSLEPGAGERLPPRANRAWREKFPDLCELPRMRDQSRRLCGIPRSLLQKRRGQPQQDLNCYEQNSTFDQGPEHVSTVAQNCARSGSASRSEPLGRPRA